MEFFNFLVRWGHLLFGITWIGMLYYFNFVQGGYFKQATPEALADAKSKLAPSALWWFRWGAAYTWLTGLLLLFLLYYHGDYGYAIEGGGKPTLPEGMIPFWALFAGFLFYDYDARRLAKKSEPAAMVLWAAFVIWVAYILRENLGHSSRSVLVHVGAMFGTSMAANVWMHIWPAQKRIITAIKDGDAPSPDDVSLATMRSRHNTYMSVPLLLLMLSVHDIGQFSADPVWYAGIVISVGWLATYGCYKMSANVKGF